MLSTVSQASSISRLFKNSPQLLTTALVVLVLALPTFSSAATPWYSHGKSHTLTFTEDGKVWALGGNYHGQLGNGTFGGESLEPTMINGLDGVVAVQAGSNHSVALLQDGTVWTWGFNGSGQLGNGTTRNSSVPHKVKGIDNVKAIAGGSGHVVALKQDGTVWAWGGNQSGQVGNGGFQDCKTPSMVSGLRNVTAIVAGAFNTTVLKKDGSLWSWGFNGTGQLGNGNNERSGLPVRVVGIDNVRAVAAGDWHVAALKHDGTVWAWGSNRDSQLGKTKVSHRFSPEQVTDVKDITDITASIGHTIAIAKNNTVWAWGDAGTGVWGNGVSMNGSVLPVPVSGYSDPVTVAAVVHPGTVLRNVAVDSALLADAGAGHTNSMLSEIFASASQ